MKFVLPSLSCLLHRTMVGLSNTKRAVISEAVVTFSPGSGLVLALLSFPVKQTDHTIQDLPLYWGGGVAQ